jgi:hypothetical protein
MSLRGAKISIVYISQGAILKRITARRAALRRTTPHHATPRHATPNAVAWRGVAAGQQ